VYFSLGFFLKLEHITVKKEGKYTDKQIVEASKAKLNDNMFSIRIGQIKKNIERELLEVENVEVKKKFPCSILIVVHEAKPTYAVKTGEKYIILSAGLKILNPEALTIDKSLDIINGVKLENVIAGEFINHGKEAVKLIELTELSALIKKAGLRNIRDYDLSDPQNIELFYSRAEIGSRIKIKFGSSNQMAYKIKFLAKMFDGSIDERVSGEIDLTDLISSKKAIWKPLTERTKTNEAETNEVTKETSKNNG
jgi:cell division septal protein FtsQ